MPMKHIRKFFEGFSTASFLAGVICAVMIAAAVVFLFLSRPEKSVSRPDSVAAVKKIAQIEEIIRMKYLEEADEQKQTDMMMQGLVAGLGDSYASYYTKEEYEEVKRSNAGLTKGIGITISQEQESGELVIISVSEGSSAEKAGLLEGDVILTVCGQDIAGKSSLDAAQIIQETEGTITLTVRRPGTEEPLEFSMEKGEIKAISVMGMMLEDQIGYIQIRTFNGLTPEQFAESYASLREQDMKALIIDLRNNLGGLVSACVDTAGQILPEGPIVYEQDRDGGERHQDSRGETPIDIPLILLVNGYTASSSEIFTGAVKDYGIGTIVGEQTYGKGVEQNTFLLTDGSAVKLTTTVYYTPNHSDINGTGITPDVEVIQPLEETVDRQLEKAMEILNGG